MKRLVPVVAAFSVGAVAAVAGCANGTSDVDPSEEYLAATPADGGTKSSESVKAPPSDTDSEEKDAGGSPDTTDGGTPSGTPDGGSVGGSCTAPNACKAAVDLGKVSGDVGADVKTAEGATSEWLKVRVTEDDSGAFATELWMTATLTSPPGTNFDLFLYVPSADTLECSSVTSQSTSSSTTDTASAKFGENDLFANGSSDDRWVTVEVRHVSGNCDPGKKWSLKIEGNK